jgi:CBS domain containing-hemolysin-like protein
VISSAVIVLVTLLATTFFSGMETAFVSSDKLRIELDKTKNLKSDRLIEKLTRDPAQFTVTMLIGNMLALITFSVSFFGLFQQHLQSLSNHFFQIFIPVTISGFAVLIMGYLLPKAIFNINPNRALIFFVFPVAFFFYLFYPVTRFSIFTTQILSGIWSKGAQINKNKIFGKINQDIFTSGIDNSMDDNPNHELKSEIRLFKNALEFSRVRVRDCMIQRPDIEVLEDNTGIEQLRQKFIETGFSKILIYREHVDNITGYVHSFDLLNNPKNISSCLRDVSFVPETMEAKKLLPKMLKEHRSIAVVVDEFGGTAGIITTEDILEEIFGEIEDEHDKPDFIIKKITENRYIFSGRTEIESINEMYGLNLQMSSSYETIAGYILFHHSSFPKSNTILQIGAHEFRILRSSRNSIDLVEMRILEK